MKTTSLIQGLATTVAVIFVLSANSAFAQSRKFRNDNPLYVGYEIFAGTKVQELKSDVAQLSGLKLSTYGGGIGMRVANNKTSLRATTGLYYSGESVGYTINVFEAGLSGNVYLAEILNSNNTRAIEPYFVSSVRYQQAHFFGTYLDRDSQNKSVVDEPSIGKVAWMSASAGMGMEFQLESYTGQFLRFFAQATYSLPLAYQVSNNALNGTTSTGQVNVTIGTCFGKVKNTKRF